MTNIWTSLLFAILLSDSSNALFSGFYRPNTTYSQETYGASWLAPRHMFLSSRRNMLTINALEGATTSVLNARAVMTRDYFDYFVEHLSSTVNILTNYELDALLVERLQRKIQHYRSHLRKSRRSPGPFHNNTVAIMPFSTNAFRPSEPEAMRIAFFELTYLSIYIHFPHIAVAVEDDRHLRLLESLNLPAVFHVFMCQKTNAADYDLMKSMLLQTHDKLSSADVVWSKFKYVFFTESDQVTHLRVPWELARLLERSEESFMITPHRMNTMVLPKDMPNNLQEHSGEPWRINILKDVNLMHESVVTPRGSCCDDGRYIFTKQCGNFWYFCEDWGMKTLDKNWVKFGAHGFTMPLVTEHQGKCKYYPNRIQCLLPDDCDNSIPMKKDSVVCKEVQKAIVV